MSTSDIRHLIQEPEPTHSELVAIENGTTEPEIDYVTYFPDGLTPALIECLVNACQRSETREKPAQELAKVIDLANKFCAGQQISRKEAA